MGCNNGCGFGGGGCLWIILDHYPALLLLRRRELGRLRLWWLWLQQRLREQLLLRRQYNSRTANRQTCRGVFFPTARSCVSNKWKGSGTHA